MRRKAFTVVEALTALAIVATLIGLLVPAVMAARDNAARVVDPQKPREPPESIWLSTVKHDGHWFIVRGDSWGLHHPDCPCRSRTPEAE
jgi:type II secretory pathway pseudopilin PulG